VRVLYCVLLLGGFACSDAASPASVSKSMAQLSDSGDRERAQRFVEQSLAAVSVSASDLGAFYQKIPSDLAQQLDTARVESAGFFDALAHELDGRVCAETTSLTELATIVFLMSQIPPAVSVSAIDCVVDRYPHEDHLLWTVIAAWRRAGFPQSAGIDGLRGRANDTRTIHRLLSLSELKEWKRNHQSENVIQAVESVEL